MLVKVRYAVSRPKRNIVLHHLLHQKTRLCVSAEQHSKITVALSPLHRITNIADDPQILLPLILKNGILHPGLRRECRADALLEALIIVPDQIQRILDNIGLRPVIRVEKHGFRPRNFTLKPQHNLRLCSAEAVDRLVVIPHNKQISLLTRKQPDHLKLNLVDVLELVNQNVGIFFLPGSQNILPLLEKLPCIQKHILEVNQMMRIEIFVVLAVNSPEHLFPAVRGIVMIE